MEKIYNDPEIGEVRLAKSSASRRISIRVHPDDGVRVIIPRSVSFDAGLRFFVDKRAWVIETMARQRRRVDEAEMAGKALPRLADGAVVRTLISEVLIRRRGSCLGHGLDSGLGSGAGRCLTAGLDREELDSGLGHGLEGVSNRDEEAKRVRISVRTETVDEDGEARQWMSLTMPALRKTIWYETGIEDGNDALDRVLKEVLVNVLRHEAKALLPMKVEEFARRYGFNYGRVAIKHNSSNWGSCSAAGNINLNLNLVRLPEPICDAVILHELCHLRHRDHGPLFHDLLEKLCTDNIFRMAKTSKDPYIADLIKKINSNQAARPVHKTMARELIGWRLI